MDRGAAKWKTLLFLAIVGLIGYGTYLFAPPYLSQYCVKNNMQEYMRQYASMGEDTMIDTIVDAVRKECKVRLSWEDFYFDGDVLEESVMRCKYTKVIMLPGNRPYKMVFTPEVKIKIPPAAF